MSGLFSTFNIAKRGMSVQQRTIDVTSHNISNANTPGYSRQRAKIETTRPQSISGNVGQVGTGAQVAAIERVRDSFLDYQIRGESSNLGKYDARSKFLQEVETVFNEPSETGISSLMGKFFDSFQELSKQPNSSNARTIVAQQSASLADALNHTYTQLEKLQTNAQESIKAGVTGVNSILNQVDMLNQEIISVKVSGNMPNDLLDKRDTLLDELSSKFNFVVEKKEFEGICVRPEDVGNMKTPNIINSNPNTEGARFSYVSDVEVDKNDPSGNTHVVTYYKNGNMQNEANKQTIKVSGLSKEQIKNITDNRIIWANSSGQATKGDGYPIKNGELVQASEILIFKPKCGEISGVVSVQKDIQDYMDQLNKLAKTLAFSVNAVHSGMDDPMNGVGNPDRDETPFFVNKSVAKYNKNNILSNLDDTLYGEEEITASNISMNKEILEDVMKIKTRTNDDKFGFASHNNIDGDADGARALAIAQLKNSILRVQDVNESIISRKDMFDISKGGSALQDNGMKIVNSSSGMKMESYFKDTIDRLGVQSQEAGRMVLNQEELLFSLEESKTSISGVSLDEEMANLVQFQHSYNANAKIISTIDELLDVVINGLKR
ncbi:flagellar hook-associated protein FlgK [Clostridium gasigenes]|uniref:flagellar hook-associated protein FlgK n=1 Tax=Clostridium gasigenes TaxID=94869 RepID=UPI001C0E16C2|nr:flagellar hook-associated protein FlgK [Clostridium gasigenes]MBU3109070.1 flagellar hook-associated protein FlgK [Clostridium gasigenes]